MHIQREAPDTNTIRSYSNKEIIVGEATYEHSLVITGETIITPWNVHSLLDLNVTTMEPLLQFKPEIIIIGHQTSGQLAIELMLYLSKLRIGMECMSIGAASRTFNVLLSEHRNVIAGIIFSN